MPLRKYFQTLYLVACFLRFAYSSMDCHKQCICTWRGGKQTAECIGAGLKDIPPGMSPELQVLDLGGNVLQKISGRAFQSKNLVNLQKVYLSRCGLVRIANDAFYHLSNLIELDLSSNFIPAVPTAALKQCPHLRRLLMNNNPIQKLEDDSFIKLGHLKQLELSNCVIDTVPKRAFEGLKKLEVLKLDGNKISTLPENAIKFLPPLNGLDIHNNPLYCDCNLRGVRHWMILNNVPFIVPPMCKHPSRLRGKSWDQLDLDDFACSPEVTAVDTHLYTTEGENATLGCRLHAVPDAEVLWMARGKTISNYSLMSFGRQWYVIREKGTQQKSSILTIINVKEKDSGSYMCIASNRAGNVSVNVTLTVVTKNFDSAGLSGGEIAGIVIGLLFVLLVLLAAAFVFVIQKKHLISEERKVIGVGQFKNFDSVKSNHIELNTFHRSTTLTEGSDDEIDTSLNQSKTTIIIRRTNSDGGSISSGRIRDDSDNDDAASSSTVIENRCLGNPVLVIERHSDIGDFNIESDFPEDMEGCDEHRINTGYNCDNVSDDINRTWEAEAAVASNYQAVNPAIVKRPLIRRDYIDDNRAQTIRGAFKIPPDFPKLREDGYYNVSGQGIWKRSMVHNPVHLILSPEARDSPDEGLGDEREYETDILE